MKGGLPSWFDLSDWQVTRLRELVMMVTLVFLFFVGILASDPLSFAGLGVMLLFIILPAALASAFIVPTHRLRLCWLPIAFGLASFAMFFLIQNDGMIQTAIMLVFYVSCGLSIALAVPEFRLVGRFIPSLHYVDDPHGTGEGRVRRP